MSVILFSKKLRETFPNQRFRHELKYLVKIDEADSFFKDILPYCEYDKHVDETNSYEIASTYYDTKDLRFFYDREESVGFRRKIRLRTYNKDKKAIALFLEIKEKHKQFVSKKRLRLKDMSILDSGLAHDKIPLSLIIDNLEDSAEVREFKYLHNRLEILPIVITRYIRKPLIPKYEDDMRITLDIRITAGGNSLPVYDEHAEKFIIKPDQGVLEVKSNKGIPIWLHSALARYSFVQTRYSKYCLGVEEMFGRHKPYLVFQEKRGREKGQIERLAMSS